ncbi:hypothetical protein GLOIN_2v1876445 [Rhizophagus clarus]|uniref:F-box domain-containing protein n=1 Tax=Rhizophagus clarus TaxID=94130 RepID=A0A8H3QD62_9GLOM|nr:hypothetical protein GLOIN_2v1876445 [Rhizophagus clarus]
MLQLPTDCLNDIFENLDDDRSTLHSCILVNRLWCEISVRFFWRNGCNYNISNFNTLVSCLPNKSKEILSNNGITILSETTKFPTFNYASFCKVLSINHVQRKIEALLKNKKSIPTQILKDNTNIVVQEICKMFMDQISSLKKLVLPNQYNMPNLALNPGSKDCLKNLSELRCYSNISSETFYQLSRICQNISLLNISHGSPFIPDGLADLISNQKNLKHFILGQYIKNANTSSLIKKLPSTLIKLNLCDFNYISLSFIAELSNLQELRFSFEYKEDFIDFEKLSYVNFSQLQILKFQYSHPNSELLIRFLENNGKNLKEFYLSKSNNMINLSISKFCTNLRKLSAGFKNDELENLKMILKSCKNLKCIEIFCGGKLLNEKEALEVIVNHSHENISKIILHHYYCRQSAKLLPKKLESIIVKWANCVPQRLLSLEIFTNKKCKESLDKNKENMKIIKKYIKLGIIKNFIIRGFNYDEF